MTVYRYNSFLNHLPQMYRTVRDALEGELQMRSQGAVYVPKLDGLTSSQFDSYLQRGTWYGTPEMTLRALSGLALRKDPVLALPERLEPMKMSAGADGAPLLILIEEMVNEVIAMGRFGLLLDFPSANTNSLTLPHVATYRAESIEDYRVEWIEGRLELTRVVLATDEKFMVGDTAVDVWMELVLEDTIYKARRFYLDKKERVDIGDEIIPTVQGKALNRIPFLMVSHKSLRPSDEKPPLFDLCNLAAKHFAQSCDRAHALHLTACPTPFIIGSIHADNKPTSIGSGALWVLPEGSEVGMLEFEGAGVAAMKDFMDELMDAMAALGARMLSTS